MKILQQKLFAIKTHTANHESRLPILRGTWLNVTYHSILVSDSFESKCGTTVSPGAEKNTAFGHCRKSMSILKHFKSKAKKNNWNWLVIGLSFI